MSADNIDVFYAEDGRTLKTAQVDGELGRAAPGTSPAPPGRRIAGRTIDIAMGSDGATVTGLNAAEHVQVDLPADGDTPGPPHPRGVADPRPVPRGGPPERRLHRQRRLP